MFLQAFNSDHNQHGSNKFIHHDKQCHLGLLLRLLALQTLPLALHEVLDKQPAAITVVARSW